MQTSILAALAALTLLAPTLASAHSHAGPGKRHAALKSAFSQRTRTRRQNFLSTTQPSNLAAGAATADEGCTLWIQSVSPLRSSRMVLKP
jgi:hypothetical protein